jgi:septal ring factor EnvC (AmiA/AmiB activator)
LLGLAFTPVAGARLADPPAANAEQDLERVRDRIREVAKAFAQDVEARDQAVQALRAAETEVAGARSRLDSVRLKLGTAERRHAQLAARKQREQAALEAQRAALAGQLRAAYSTGRAESARLLLQSDDPGALPRLLAWYGYFGRARAAKIGEIRAALERIDELDVALAAQQVELRSLVAERAGEVGALEEARRSRDQLVAQARAQVANRNAELKRLRRQEARVGRLVERLQQAVVDKPFRAPPGGRAFAALRGQLPWPVSGTLVARFGQARAAGLKWAGHLIAAPEGTAVRAPYAGRVLYADWLQGLGNLLILDHGGGWITLYAHNAALLKSAGEKVDAGESIAEVGDTGGEGRSALYFEIRQGSGRASHPVNPALFLR